MYKIDIVKMAYKNLWRRKVRTFLTVLGVLIGTTSIVVMISLGIGLNEAQTRNMERWGSLNQIEVYQGVNFDEEGNPMGDANPLNDDTVEEFKAIPGVTAVSPVFNMGGEAIWGRKAGYLQIVGIDPAQMPQFEFEIEEGRLLDNDDRFNIVVGWQVGQNFYDRRQMEMMHRVGNDDGHGKTNTLNAQSKISMDVRNNNGTKKVRNLL